MQGPRDGCPHSPIPLGFILNVHLTYIPFKLVDNKTGQEILAKYIQLFLNHDDPYAYSKMSNNRPTFVGKILAAPNMDTWEKLSYTRDDLQYFTGKYCDRVEVDMVVMCLCNPSLQAEIR